MDFDDLGLEWEPMWVGRPADTHFSAGGSSPLARSNETNELTTHAILRPRLDEDEEDSDLLKMAIALAVGAAATAGVYVAIPRLKKLLERRRLRAQEKVLPEPLEPPASFAAEVDVLLDRQHMSMDNEEVQRRLLEILIAAVILARNLELLSSADVATDDRASLEQAIKRLTDPKVVAGLNEALRRYPSILEGHCSEEVQKLFGAGWTSDGEFLPLQVGRVERSLHTPPAASGAACRGCSEPSLLALPGSRGLAYDVWWHNGVATRPGISMSSPQGAEGLE